MTAEEVEEESLLILALDPFSQSVNRGVVEPHGKYYETKTVQSTAGSCAKMINGINQDGGQRHQERDTNIY